MFDFQIVIDELIKDLGKRAVIASTKALEQRGHKNTGDLEASIRYEIEDNGAFVEIQGNESGKFVETGIDVSWKQFPFLVEYFQSKGYSESASKKYAAATIQVGIQEGLSTKASRRFSRDGKRNGWIDLALEMLK